MTVAADRKVVVIVSLAFLYNKKINTFAVRVKPLGITAYGDTEDAASRRVKTMFADAVQAHRMRGDLAEWLNKSGLEWSWLDEYKGDNPVEHARGVVEKKAAQSPMVFTIWQGYRRWRWRRKMIYPMVPARLVFEFFNLKGTLSFIGKTRPLFPSQTTTSRP